MAEHTTGVGLIDFQLYDLIEHAGFGRGWGEGPARVSTKHTLALTNRGTARAGDVLELARRVRSGVEQAFGVVLEPEPVLVGCAL